MHPVTGILIVKGKPGSTVAAFNHASVESNPTWLRFSPRLRLNGGAVDGIQRIGSQHVLDVSQKKLLVLLLMVEAELDGEANFAQLRITALLKKSGHPAIDVMPIIEYLFHGGSGKKAALGLRMSFARGMVVRVEEIAVLLLEGAVVGHRLLEHEGFKKPARVGQMPFGGADVGHCLDDKVFGLERRAEVLGELADATIEISKPFTGSCCCRCLCLCHSHRM